MKLLDDAKVRMDKTLTILTDQYRCLGLAATGAFLDTIKVPYYGSMTPLPQMAVISKPYAGKFLIRPFDPACVKEVERTLHKANLGMNVSADKTSVQVLVPTMSMEQKEKMADHANKLATEALTAIRRIRQDVRKQIQKQDLSEDEEKATEKKLQQLTDEFCEEVDNLSSRKQNSLLG